MTNRYLSVAAAVLILLISHSIAFAEDTGKAGSAQASYITLDPGAFNKSVTEAGAEKWTSDPVAVSLRFTGPFEGLTQTIERKNVSAESPDKTAVTITNEGLLDDSVMGEKFFLKLKRAEQGAWLIESAAKTVKCWPGRGHQDYSNKPCK